MAGLALAKRMAVLGAVVAWSAPALSDPDDHGDSLHDATDISLPAVMVASLGPEPGDVDVFRAHIDAPTRLVIRTTGDTDTFGYLRGTDGRPIASDDDSGAALNFRIETERLPPGDYFIAVQGYSADVTVGNYTLSVEFLGGGRAADAAQAPDVTITPVAAGDAETSVRLSASLAGGRYDGRAIYAWSVSGGTLDDPARAEPLWTRPAVAGDQDIDITVAVIVRGHGVNARSGTSDTDRATRRARVRAVGGGSGGGDDHGNTRAGATVVAIGSGTAGELTFDDRDYFRVPFGGGRLVVGTTGSTDTYGTLFDARGGEIGSDDDGGPAFNFRIARDLPPGDVYVEVKGFDPRSTGAYRLRVEGDDGGGGALPVARAPSISIDAVADGDEGETVRLSAALQGGLFDGEPAYAWSVGAGTLDAADAASPLWTRPAVNGNRDVRIGLTLTVRGDGRTARAGTRAQARATGTGRVRAGGRPSGDDHGNTRAEATAVAVDSVADGELTADDRDYFRVPFGGGRLVVGTTGSTDTYGTLFDARGREIGQDDDAGPAYNFHIARDDLPAGDVYVEVRGYSPSSTGAYRLHVDGDDGGGGGGRALPVARAPSVTMDAVPDGTEGASVRLGADLRGGLFDGAPAYAWSVTAGSLDAADAQRPLWTRPEVNASRDVSITLTVTVRGDGADARAGTRAQARAARSARVLDAPGRGDDHGNDPETATPVGLPSTTNGQLGAGDHDYFSVNLSRPVSLTLETTGATDTYGVLYNAAGNALGQDDDRGAGRNFRIRFAGLPAGRYDLLVRGYSPSDAGDYRLHVRGETATARPDAHPPALAIDPIADGQGGRAVQLGVALTGGAYDGAPEYLWTVAAGTLDDPAAPMPVWTRPTSQADRDVTVQVQVTVRGNGTAARAGSVASARASRTARVRTGGGTGNRPPAAAPRLTVHAIPAGGEGTTVRLAADLAGGTYDGAPAWRWAVDAGALDDATAVEPRWTRPQVTRDQHIDIRLAVTVRGDGTTARAGSSDRVSSRGVAALVRDTGDAPVLSLDIVAPPAGDEGDTVDLAARLYGAPPGARVTYEWRVDDGVLDDATAPTPSWTLPRVPSNADFYVRLTATVDGTAVSARRLMRIRDHQGDHGDTRDTATTVAVPAAVRGWIDSATDRDVFRFILGNGAPTGELLIRTLEATDTVGTLFDSAGGEIARNDDGPDPNAGFRISTTLGAGEYFLEVKGADASVRGPYSLWLGPPPTNRAPTADPSQLPDLVNLTAGGAAWAVFDPRTAFGDGDGDAIWTTATSSNPSVVRVEYQAASMMVHPVGAGHASVTVTGSDPSGESAVRAFAVSVEAPVRSDPAATFDSTGETLTLDFADTFAAGERRAYQAGVRQVDPRGVFRAFCLEATSSAGGSEGVSLDLPTADFAEPGMEYEAVYRYVGGSCSAPSGGDAIFSRRATATAPGSPSFRIEAVLLGSASTAVRQATDEAVRSWEDVFAASLPNVDYTRTPINAGCARGAPLVADVVDDVRVFVEVVFIDGVGGTVARAGPCYIRAPSGLPILSTVRLDSADFEAMPHALRVEVIEHELAHALGFASLGWQRANLLRDPSVGGFKSDFGTVAPDTHFVGVDATRAFNSAGGQDYSGAKVPVENAIGGIGNRDSHWRESVLGNELMTTAIGRDVSHPLSAITVGAMRDLGYTVNARAADAYRVPATRSSSFPSLSSALDTPTAKTLAIRSSSATPRDGSADRSDEGGGVVCGGPFDWAPQVHGTGNLPVGAWNADAIPLTGRAHLSSSSRQGSD